MIDINLRIDEKKLLKNIVREIQRIIFGVMPEIQSSLNNQMKDIIFKRLVVGVPTISGRDLQEIGVPDINNRLMSIIRVASESFNVKVYQDSTSLLKIDIGILDDNYSDVLNLPEAIYQTYRGGQPSYVLEWLKWLLLFGQNMIIQDYSYDDTYSPYSRTRGGIMKLNNQGWYMPDHLSGNKQNNILTRALSNIDKDIENLVESVLIRKLK